MKWERQFNQQGYYWWRADSVVGEFTVAFDERRPVAEGHSVSWLPMNGNDDVEIGRARTEEEGKALVGKYLKRLSKALAKEAK